MKFLPGDKIRWFPGRYNNSNNGRNQPGEIVEFVQEAIGFSSVYRIKIDNKIYTILAFEDDLSLKVVDDFEETGVE